LQQAAIKALDNSDEWHRKRNEIYNERREWIFKILDLLQFEYKRDQVGLFVWAKPKDPAQVPNVAAYVDELLYKAFVFITPGEIFGSNGSKFLRMSLCVPLEKIKEAYERLEKVVK
jgi:hypothetical protein